RDGGGAGLRRHRSRLALSGERVAEELVEVGGALRPLRLSRCGGRGRGRRRERLRHGLRRLGRRLRRSGGRRHGLHRGRILLLLRHHPREGVGQHLVYVILGIHRCFPGSARRASIIFQEVAEDFVGGEAAGGGRRRGADAEHLLHFAEKLALRVRLRQDVGGAHAHRVLLRALAAVAGDGEENRGGGERIAVADRANQLRSAHFRNDGGEDDEPRRIAFDRTQRFLAVLREERRERLAGQSLPHPVGI